MNDEFNFRDILVNHTDYFRMKYFGMLEHAKEIDRQAQSFDSVILTTEAAKSLVRDINGIHQEIADKYLPLHSRNLELTAEIMALTSFYETKLKTIRHHVVGHKGNSEILAEIDSGLSKLHQSTEGSHD